MLKTVLKKLDLWIEEQNKAFETEGLRKFHSCKIRIVGQTALIEANLSLHVPATMDVDVFADYEHSVQKKFEALLKEIGKELDPVGHEAWMPQETEYQQFYSGSFVTAYLAKPEFVILSKAKKAPQKNSRLITEYLASEPPAVFFELAKKYQIDLERFV